jgi:L-lactate dehydrogenase complex protein LldG
LKVLRSRGAAVTAERQHGFYPLYGFYWEEKMSSSVRDEILSRLKAAPKVLIPPRPPKPKLHEHSLTGAAVVEKFVKTLIEETGIVHQVKNNEEALQKLLDIAREEGLKKVMASNDEIIAPLNLKAWGEKHGLRVMTPKDYPDRDSYRDAVFDQADAGITGANFAVAESGSLGLAFHPDQARLVSLAPILHIAIVPVDRVLAYYEQGIKKIFGEKGKYPSQFVFITGPSMTGDIEGVLFKGMHGPRKVFVILVG